MAYASTPVLSKIKIGEQYYYLKDADARALLDTVVADYLKTADKTELLAAISAEETRAEGIEATLQSAITALQGKVGESTDTASPEGSLYARIKQEIADRATAITNAIAQEVTDRNTAIANAINALDVTDTAVDGKYVSAVNEVDGKIVVSRTDLPAATVTGVKDGEKIIALSGTELTSTLGVKIEKRDSKDYIVLTGIEGAEVASVDASAFVKDGMIDTVELITKTVGSEEHTFIKITFNTDAGKQPIELDVTTLIDVYTAGDGLALANNKFSVVKDPASESYLTVTANGVKVSGIADAIAAAVAAEETRAKAAEQANTTAITDEVTRATNKEAELNTAIGAEKTRAEAAEQANAAAITAEETRAKAAEKANADAITAIKDGTDIDSFKDVEDALDLKADNDDLNTLAGRVTTAESDITALEGHMDTAEGEIDTLQTDMTQAKVDIDANTAAIASEKARAEEEEAAIRSQFAAADALKVDKTQKVAGIDLQDDITVTEMQNALGLENLAYSDTASGSGTGTVPGQTITGVKATGDLSGTASITMNYTATNVKSTGSIVAEGNVTINAFTQTSTAATLTKGDYTPAGSVAVATTEVEASKVLTAGTAYSITNGNAVKGADTTSKFVKKAMNMTVGSGADAECLIISEVATTDTSFYADAVTAAGDVTYTAPVLSGALPTFTSVKADKVGGATFTGTEAKNALVTAVNYDKATANGATFSGTSVGVEVNGNYDKANQPTGDVTISGAELDVGTITVAEKSVTVNVTVTPDA